MNLYIISSNPHLLANKQLAIQVYLLGFWLAIEKKKNSTLIIISQNFKVDESLSFLAGFYTNESKACSA